MLERQDALRVQSSDVEHSHFHVETQSHDEAHSDLAQIRLDGVGVLIAPLELAHGIFVVIQDYHGLILLGGPNHKSRIFLGRTRQQMASRIPLNNFDRRLVASPDSLGGLWGINRPKIDHGIACSCELPIILPHDLDNLPGLMELTEGLLLDKVGPPYQDASVIATRGNQRILLAPDREDQLVLASEEAGQLATHIPDPSDIVIGHCQQSVAGIAPLDRGNVVGLIRSIEVLAVLLGSGDGDMPELEAGVDALGGGGRSSDHIGHY